MSRKKKTDLELWHSLEALDNDLLDVDAPIESAHEVIRNAGLDLEVFRSQSQDFVSALLKKRRLSWQANARDKARAMALKTARTLYLGLSGEKLRELLAERRTQASTGGLLAAAFRARSEDEMTDEEIRDLLADIDAVIAISDEDGKA